VGAPSLKAARADGLAWDDATVEAFLVLLGARGDTHIARKLGADAAGAISRQAREIMAAGGVRHPAGREALRRLDTDLRDPTNRRNPGTTADLTCAALFVVILEGGWDR
jgi:triphosphoribosyl-dephospho-CoA synthase